MRRDKERLEITQTQTTLLIFLELYNKSIPAGFPRTSAAMLKKFQDSHPALFRMNGMWSIDRHRKKVMDWLSSHPEIL